MAVQNPEFSLQASFGVEHVRSLPEFLQNVQEIQDQSDAERSLDQNLQGSVTIGERHPRLDALRITALHLLGHLLNDGGLAFEQTGPHPLVLWTGRNLATGGG